MHWPRVRFTVQAVDLFFFGFSFTDVCTLCERALIFFGSGVGKGGAGLGTGRVKTQWIGYILCKG
jgi:hypothetical protein